MNTGRVKIRPCLSRRRNRVWNPNSNCVCPSCRGALHDQARRLTCQSCGRAYPVVAGLPDLRLAPDRYLSLDAERAKAQRLARLETRTDFSGLATAYYAVTQDVDRSRRDRYLKHLARAEARGKVLERLLPEVGRILEIGCGSGGFLAACASQGRCIQGVDIALRWLVLARRRLADRVLDVPLVGACAESLPYEDGTFDAVVADSVLEHLADPSRALREWARVVRPGGRLLVWSPNRFTLGNDPHVGLWGVGWLPTPWATAYVRSRRHCGWTVRPLSAGQAARLASDSGWKGVRVKPPELEPILASGRVGQFVLRTYNRLRPSTWGMAFLRAIGPLWQLEATRDST